MQRANGAWNEAASQRGDERVRRIAGVGLLVALCGAFLFAGQFPDGADGKKKKKKFNFAGKWTGTNEDGGPVSFTITRNGQIVGFTLTNVELECRTQPTFEYEYKKAVTITHGPMQMKGKSRKFPQGKRFEFHDPQVSRDAAGEGGDFTGELGDVIGGPTGDQVLPNKKGLIGEVAFQITNGPTPPDPAVWAPGTEECDTGKRFIDWTAKKPRTPGIVVPQRIR